MSGVVLLYQVPIEDIYLLRNAFYRCSSIMKNGYGAKFFGVSDNVEDFPPCHPSAFLNFGMGMVYFTRKEEAERFLHTDRALNEAEILKSAEVSIVPLGTPLLLGEANKYTFLITHLLTPERDSEMSDHKAIRALMSFGAVPLNSAHEETSSKEGDVKHICCGIRIIQLPAKEIFYEWIKSGQLKSYTGKQLHRVPLYYVYLYMAEHVPPLRTQPLLNVGMGMVYFTKHEDAKRFSYNEQSFMSADFLNNAEIFIVPVVTPLLIGSHATALFVTEIRKCENHNQLPDPKLMLTMSACGAVPLVADCEKVHFISGSEDRICGIRISQFPNKSAFYDWVRSDCGTKFRQAILRIRSLTSYIATFTREAL
ncbi:hypothetical protein CLF_102502 [Clonorchis sinensis]|uniref:Uncharacterized protein n=1 Tax=Clonorchis sinensis TaxID=79923 RepID=G7YN30_CLOSI|nr:hypothetical protein CLF_102502 [Clonorchis sinensis]